MTCKFSSRLPSRHILLYGLHSFCFVTKLGPCDSQSQLRWACFTGVSNILMNKFWALTGFSHHADKRNHATDDGLLTIRCAKQSGPPTEVVTIFVDAPFCYTSPHPQSSQIYGFWIYSFHIKDNRHLFDNNDILCLYKVIKTTKIVRWLITLNVILTVY